MARLLPALLFAIFAFAVHPANAAQPWMTLPPFPILPKPDVSGTAPVNGVKIWYAEFGHGEPVLFLHGGLGWSDCWANQVRYLMPHYRVIVMDSRGHGRSTRDAQPFGYDLMASDVVGLLDYLHIRKVALVGWSDGAIIGLDIAMHHPERLSKLFAFAANYDTAGVADASKSSVVAQYLKVAGEEYARISPTPTQYAAFQAQIEKMWATQPNWTQAELAKITVLTWIVDSDHDEMVTHDQPRTLADWIPNSSMLIEPGVSHFGFVQDPDEFNRDIEHFLQQH
jgi:pimeloyl-ACP methyl ester carboxylesterase